MKYFVSSFDGVSVPLCDQDVTISQTIRPISDDGVQGRVPLIDADWDTVLRTEVSLSSVDPTPDLIAALIQMKSRIGRKAPLVLTAQFGSGAEYRGLAQLVSAPTRNNQQRFPLQDYELSWVLETHCFFSPIVVGDESLFPSLIDELGIVSIPAPALPAPGANSTGGTAPSSGTPHTVPITGTEVAYYFLYNGTARHHWIVLELPNDRAVPVAFNIEVQNTGHHIEVVVPANETYIVNAADGTIKDSNGDLQMDAFINGVNRRRSRLLGLDIGVNTLKMEMRYTGGGLAPISGILPVSVSHMYGVHL